MSSGLNPHKIRQMERGFLSGLPALHEELRDGWQLRWADGFTRRANSVTILDESATPFEAQFTYAKEWFETRDQALRFRISPLGASVDPQLDERGLIRTADTFALGRDLVLGDVHGVIIANDPTDAWVQAWFDFAEQPAAAFGVFRRMLERIALPAAYAVIRDRNQIQAVGRAVESNRTLRVFNVAVDPRLRRSGLGTHVMNALELWGHQQGARAVELFVEEANKAALAMYRNRGFDVLYRYWYRS